MRVAPDQSLLALDSDTSGNWPLVRLRKWWTDTPVNEVLSVPGWNAVDAKYVSRIKVDLQITPDGRYAVAFAGAVWTRQSDFIFSAPRGYVERTPDTIVTVIDLDQWKIVSSVHTAVIRDWEVRGVRVVSDKWIALDFFLGGIPGRSLLARYITELVTVPELHAGPDCVSDRQFRRAPRFDLGAPETEKLMRQNDQDCEAVLQSVGIASVEALEILIQRGQDALPATIENRSDGLKRTEDDYFQDWGEYPFYLITAENPPFESSSHQWYGLYNAQERRFYDLEMFDTEGRKQKAQTVRNLLCGDPSLEQPGSACGCRVVDVSEEQHDLLAYCRTQRGDYDGMVRRKWLAVLHSDDFSGAGFISLPKTSWRDDQTLEMIARGDNHPYIVTLAYGEVLRIYAIPDRP